MMIRSLLQQLLVLLLIGAMSSQAIASSVMQCQMQESGQSSAVITSASHSHHISNEMTEQSQTSHRMSSDMNNMSHHTMMSGSSTMFHDASMGDCCEQLCQCPTGGCFVSALIQDSFLFHIALRDNADDFSLLNGPIHSTDPHFRPPTLNA